ncbi:MAG: hypothetical protein AAF960_21330, partial [Bacteroidota bacterium]
IVSSRKSQYNLWFNDTIYNNQEVFVPNEGGLKMQPNSPKKNGSFNYYLSFDKKKTKSLEDKFNTKGTFKVSIENPYNYSHTISDNDLNIFIVLFKDKKAVAHVQSKAIESYTLEKKEIQR